MDQAEQTIDLNSVWLSHCLVAFLLSYIMVRLQCKINFGARILCPHVCSGISYIISLTD